MTDRIQAIEEMLAKNPNDLFLRYSLGMEQAATGRGTQAVETFRRCIELDENYLPAYVEAGKALRSAGDLAAARDMFLEGLDLANRQGQRHVRDFIQQQIEGLPATEKQGM